MQPLSYYLDTQPIPWDTDIREFYIQLFINPYVHLRNKYLQIDTAYLVSKKNYQMRLY